MITIKVEIPTEKIIGQNNVNKQMYKFKIILLISIRLKAL